MCRNDVVGHCMATKDDPYDLDDLDKVEDGDAQTEDGFTRLEEGDMVGGTIVHLDYSTGYNGVVTLLECDELPVTEEDLSKVNLNGQWRRALQAEDLTEGDDIVLHKTEEMDSFTRPPEEEDSEEDLNEDGEVVVEYPLCEVYRA